MNQNQPSVAHWFTLIFLSIIWGSSFILMKKGLVSFSPNQVAGLRIGIAFLFFLPYALSVVRKIPRDKWIYVTLIGLLGSFIPAFLFTTAETQIDSAPAGILNSLTPLFTYTWGVSLFHQPQNKRRLLGIVIGFLGALVLVIQPHQNFSINQYALLIVLATMMYGLSGNIAKYFLQEVNPRHITAVSFLFVGVPALLFVLFSDFFLVMKTDENAYQSLFYVMILSLLGTAFALMLFWKLIQETDPLFGSLSTYFIPFVAVLWGLLDGEQLQWHQFFGFGLILFSVFLVKSKTIKQA